MGDFHALNRIRRWELRENGILVSGIRELSCRHDVSRVPVIACWLDEDCYRQDQIHRLDWGITGLAYGEALFARRLVHKYWNIDDGLMVILWSLCAYL